MKRLVLTYLLVAVPSAGLLACDDGSGDTEPVEYDCLSVQNENVPEVEVCRPVEECLPNQRQWSMDYDQGWIGVYAITENPYTHLSVLRLMRSELPETVGATERVASSNWHFDMNEVETTEKPGLSLVGDFVRIERNDEGSISSRTYIAIWGVWFNRDAEQLSGYGEDFFDSIEVY